MSRIEAALREKRSRGGKALVVFLMFGYPDVDTFEGLLFAAEAAGADVVEVGLPFSDPAADGPVIRRASHLALAAGATVTSLFECVAGCRARGLRVPLLLMTYSEPVHAFGTAGLCSAAAEAGIDGMLVAELAPEGADAFVASVTAAGLEMVVLVTPGTPERMIPTIVDRCSGFVYCASVDGVTGGETRRTAPAARTVARVRRHTDLPALVGFGVAGEVGARSFAAVSDGVIVGSALLQAVGDRLGGEAVDRASVLLARLRTAVDQVSATSSFASNDMSSAGSNP